MAIYPKKYKFLRFILKPFKFLLWSIVILVALPFYGIYLIVRKLTGATVNHTRNMDEIFVFYKSIAWGTRKVYKIDIKNKMFLANHKLRNNLIGQDGLIGPWELGSESLECVRELEDEKIEDFISQSKKYGFALWDGHYDFYGHNSGIMDATDWTIWIMFSDGTSRYARGTCGSRKNPKSWAEMADAFETLTGENILYHRKG